MAEINGVRKRKLRGERGTAIFARKNAEKSGSRGMKGSDAREELAPDEPTPPYERMFFGLSIGQGMPKMGPGHTAFGAAAVPGASAG